MDVQVVCAEPSASEPEDYVRVHTCTDPFDDTVTLATIERVVDKTIVGDDGVKPRKKIKTLVMRHPMSEDQALDLATSYAERKKIPVVYASR
jgi:hypothetical protein